MKVDGRLSESFPIGVGLRQGCVILPWLFNIFMDGFMRKMKVGNVGARPEIGRQWWHACL